MKDNHNRSKRRCVINAKNVFFKQEKADLAENTESGGFADFCRCYKYLLENAALGVGDE